jgi:hypothetical protein
MGARVLQTGDTVYPNILGAEEQGVIESDVGKRG